MELRIIMLPERSQAEIAKDCMNLLIYGCRTTMRIMIVIVGQKYGRETV
jgi:hypothetical protein